MPFATPMARYLTRTAVVVVGSLLFASSAYTESGASTPARSAPTEETLLSGAKSPEGDFRVATGFRLNQNTILLQAQPEGASSVESFVVDSGAPMTIAPALARELGLQTLATVDLAGPEGGHLSVPVTRIPGLNIAGLKFHDVGAVVDWVEAPNPLACLSTAGLLGASLLQAAIWQIDFETQEIVITNSLSQLPGLANAMKIPFKRSDAAGSPRISVGVSDAEDVSLLLDLGFNGSIAMPLALLEKSGDRIADTAPTEEGHSSSTVFGQKSSSARIAKLSELRIGDLRLKDFPVVTGTAVSDFHVGIDFLRHFRVTVDWLHNDLYLEPREKTSALYPDFATYGFKLQLRDEQLVVGAIWRGSAADKAGMSLGDPIVKLDGHDTRAADFSTLCAMSDVVGLFARHDAPVSVTWIHDGEQKTSQIAKTQLLQ
jgi:predicted aspartyl protease